MIRLKIEVTGQTIVFNSTMDEIHSAIAPRLDITRKISMLEWLLLISILITGPILALLIIFLNTIWIFYTTLLYIIGLRKADL